MTSHTVADAPPTQRPGAAPQVRSSELYLALLADPHGAASAARAWLRAQVSAVQDMPADLPPDMQGLHAWVRARTEDVGAEYREYLAARKAGAPRRYFSSRAHALYFLRAVAPTKLVDGAWLYGMLAHWDNPDYLPLIRTYLEELGDGVPDKNHVTLYRKLMASHGCEEWEQLPDRHFVQGAIQLALGHNAAHFLPEIIGYNLGYEQLPLHLLITAYELDEFGIDPYYFTLHVTVDNAASGHAHKAVQALELLAPRVGDREGFCRRVLDGYRLNELGAGTTSVIAEFDLQQELVRILVHKSAIGRNMHSDYCRVGGRSVNDWLADPAQVPAFLAALEEAGWIKRGEHPANSRFWRLIQGERAGMFGVFSAYEQQVLRDWIAARPDGGLVRCDRRTMTFRARQRALDSFTQHDLRKASLPERGLIRRHGNGHEEGAANELRQLEERIASTAGKKEAMALLGELMSPATHHTATGLMATRLYARLLDA